MDLVLTMNRNNREKLLAKPVEDGESQRDGRELGLIQFGFEFIRSHDGKGGPRDS